MKLVLFVLCCESKNSSRSDLIWQSATSQHRAWTPHTETPWISSDIKNLTKQLCVFKELPGGKVETHAGWFYDCFHYYYCLRGENRILSAADLQMIDTKTDCYSVFHVFLVLVHYFKLLFTEFHFLHSDFFSARIDCADIPPITG